MQSIPALEEWLEAESDSWSILTDREYRAFVARWREQFLDRVSRIEPSQRGYWASLAIESRLPGNVTAFCGYRVERFANSGFPYAAGYEVNGLRSVLRSLANQYDLILSASDFSWSCIYTHEAGTFSGEAFFDTDPE